MGRAVGCWPFPPRSRSALLGLAVALVATWAGGSLLPQYPRIFDLPDVGPGLRAYSPEIAGIELILVPLLLAIAAPFAWHARSRSALLARLGSQFELIAATVIALLGLAVLLAVLRFPLRANVIASAAAVGIPQRAAGLAQDLAQMLIPLRLLLISTLIAPLVRQLTAETGTRVSVVGVLAGALIVASPGALVVHGFLHPLKGYEAAEDSGLRSILRAVPRDRSLRVASDLADPAEGTTRGLRGFLLTAYEGHEFYAANIAYLNYLKPDAGERMANLRAFFGSQWTAWHDQWLSEAKITHVIVHERCLPLWWDRRENVLSLVEASGAWSLLVPRRPGEAENHDRPAASPIPQHYGRAGCLQ